jgi:Ca2+-binding EF-hand superfamily protein
VSPAAEDELAAQFKLLDVNEDSRLSMEEATKLEPIVAAVFGALDSNEDAYLSLDEFRKIPADETHVTAEE